MRSDHIVEKPDEELLQQLYEQVLQKLIDLIETINKDEVAFVYKKQQTKIYNLLMAAVINDKSKSMKAC